MTFPISQSFNGWLKLLALENIKVILVTLLTSQEPISPLKADASANIPGILVTLLVSQSFNDWLKADAP